MVATLAINGALGNYLNESCNTYGTSGPDAVFTWTAPSTGTFRFDTVGSTVDTVLAAYKGKPSKGTELTCNGDGTKPSSDASLADGASSIQVKAAAGDKLTLVIDSKANPVLAASFQLNVSRQ